MSAELATPFKTKEDFEAFIKRMVTEEMAPALEKAIKPLTEKQSDLMRDMLAEHDHGVGKGKENPLPKGFMFARMVRAAALAYVETKKVNDLDAMKFVVSKFWGSDDPVLKAIDQSVKLKEARTQKATPVLASDPDSLGNLIAPNWSSEFIELLRNRPLIRSIASVIPNPTGSLTLRRQTSASTAYWVGEGQNITASKPGVGLMNFLRKKLAALCIASNDILRYSVGPLAIPADQVILNDLLLVVALAEDLAFIRGDGTAYTPQGIRNLVLSGQVNAQSGTTLTAIDFDHMLALRQLEESNIYAMPDEIHWLMVPRTYGGLWNAAPATDTGARPYRYGLQQVDEKAPQGRILNYPAHKTNQIPKNLGGGSNQSETYCVHGPSLWIADTLNLLVDVFPGGAYQDGANVVSGISADETPIRVLREVDFNMRHQEGGSIITGVTIA